MDVIVMNQVSARELNTLDRERERKQKEIYVVVLERVYSRIKRCASVGMRMCSFDVPEVVFGYPMFDVERCIRFVIRHLAMNGFQVTRTHTLQHDKVIDISWVPPEQRALPTAATAQAPPNVWANGAPMAVGAADHMTSVHMLSHPVLTRASVVDPATSSTIVSIKRRKPPAGGGGKREPRCRQQAPPEHRSAASFVSHNILPTYAYGR